MIDGGLKLVAIGSFISAGLGMDKTHGIVWSGVIILVYTFLGGRWR
jgi:Na+/proline symporter